MEQGISCSRSPIDVQICFHHLPFALLVSWSLSVSSFNVKFCAGVTSSRTSFIASLVTATFVVYVEKFASASTSDCIARASHTTAGSSVSPTSPCTSLSHPLPALSLFFSLMHFHLPWPNPLSTVHFVTLALLLGDEEATQLHALLSVCEKSDRCAVTISQEQTLREVASLVTIDAHLLLV